MMRSVRSSLTIGRLAIQPKTTNIRAGKSNIFIYLQKIIIFQKQKIGLSGFQD